MGIFNGTDYALACSTFCLICFVGSFSMNHIMCVSLVVPSMTYIALFCFLSVVSNIEHSVRFSL